MYFSFLKASVILCLLIGGTLLLSLSGEQISSEKHLIIVDRSLSMLVEDIPARDQQISRLKAVKNHILSSLKKDGTYSIISYDRNATLETPLISDRSHIESLLEAIIPRDSGGSAVGEALTLAVSLYREIPIRVSIYTDGGSTQRGVLPNLPSYWTVDLYGVGSDLGGPIPLGYNSDGSKRYKYYSGSELIVKYERENMENIEKIANTKIQRILSSDTNTSARYLSTISLGYMSFVGFFLLFVGFFLHPYVRF